jgi:serine/threonine protein kinase
LVEATYDYEALAAYDYALWFEIIQQDVEGIDRKVMDYLSQYPNLVDAQDDHSRRASQMAIGRVKEVMMELCLWFGRYHIVESRPEHQSETCYVYKAIDERLSSPLNSQSFMALKLMKVKSQFRREICIRNHHFLSDYVIGIIRTHPHIDDFHSGEGMDEISDDDNHGVMTKQRAERFYCVVFPYADRTLFQALKNEQFDDGEMRFIFIQLVKCVQHLHCKGILHGDLKPMNIMRDNGKWKLIDFDAACRIGSDNVGWKSSTAFMPPESIYSNQFLNIAVVRSPSNQMLYHDQVDIELLLAHPSFDIWSLGCILYQLCHPDRQTLFFANRDDNLRLDDDEAQDSIWMLSGWGRDIMRRKLKDIKDDNARNLISQILSPDPKDRPSLSRILAHPYVSGKSAVRMVGQEPHYDVFLSYRVASDFRHAEYLFKLLEAKGLQVWWDKKCLEPGMPWEQGFCAGLVHSKTFVCLLSRHAINHPQKSSQNFSQLTKDSPCDNVLLEHRLALQFRALGLIEKIFPVMIGDADDGMITPSPSYTNYFESQCNPIATDVSVDSIEVKLAEHMHYMALGEPLEKNKTVRETLVEILANQGGFIAGDGKDAFHTVVNHIVSMVLEEKLIVRHGRFDSTTVTKENLQLIADTATVHDENLLLKKEIEVLKQKQTCLIC